MKNMFEIQKVLFENIKNIVEDAHKSNHDGKELNIIIYEIQNYLLMLRRLESMKINIYEYDYDEEHWKNEAEYIEWENRKRNEPKIAELADLLGYDGDISNIDEDRIWERTGH